jgi:hypothetical protein
MVLYVEIVGVTNDDRGGEKTDCVLATYLVGSPKYFYKIGI